MKRFSVVTQILDEAVGGMKIGAHGNFWRGVSLDQFVALRVFGRPLIQVGDGASSNLVKALRGETPFGRDLTPKPPGALFPRMPMGMSPVADSKIAYIARWIDDGCPDEEAETAAPMAAAAAGQDELFVTFFREFDDFFMFQATPSTGEDINTFMGDAAGAWPGWSSQGDVGAWTNIIQTANVREAVESLAASQLQIINGHFGAPVDANSLAEALWRFGAGSLPADPQRPVDPQHRMNGATMWLFWLACCDAALRLQLDLAEWQSIARAVAGGLVADALFRTDRPEGDRLAITRYQAGTPDVKQQVFTDLAGVSDDALLDHNIGLGREAMGEALVA